MKDKLLILSLLLTGTASFAQTSDDVPAIKKVIEGLTMAAYAGDYKTYLSYWADADYISRVGSDQNSLVTKRVGEEWRKVIAENAAKPSEPNKDKVTRDNWLIRVNGNSAFVVFDQYNARPDSTTRHSVEERYLERVNKEWKLVNVTVLVGAENGQTKLQEDAIKKALETETRAYHEANSDLLTAQWSTAPYAERQQSILTSVVGKPFVKGDQLRNFADGFLKAHKPTGQTTRMSDYDVHISGSTAWATFTEEILDSSGKVVNTQREVKIMERGPTGWKIVFLGTQGMK